MRLNFQRLALPMPAAFQARKRNICAASVLCAATLTLAGCGPKRMRSDFIGFERAYADTSSREVLLNLARLKNHENTYFFKLGQIQSSYRMQASLSGSGNYTIPPVNIGGNATGGGTPGLIMESDPSFTFIPVNDDTSAQLLLKPIPGNILYNLYQQGWRVDQLFRLMVDRIEFKVPLPVLDPKAAPGAPPTMTCVVKTIRNSPPIGNPANKGYLQDAASYAAFLRVSAMIYALQRSGYLKIAPKSDFVPIDEKSFISIHDPTDSGGNKTSGAGDKPMKAPIPLATTSTGTSLTSTPALAPVPPAPGPATDSGAAPKASDLAAAAAKGQSWRYIDATKQWILGQPIQNEAFYLTATKEEIVANDVFLNDPDWASLMNSETPDIAFPILKSNFSLDDIGSASGPSCGTAHTVMRSLVGILAAAAQEEDAFNPLRNDRTGLPLIVPAQALEMIFPADKERLSKLKAVPFAESVPKIEMLPLLRMDWKEGDKPGPHVAELNYRGHTYRIADQEPSVVNPDLSPENANWNHDMFRLINQLIAQVTVDISKFPLPGIVQLHTN